MSHLNFSMSARQAVARSRVYNPREHVTLRSGSTLWNFLSIVSVMTITFLIVWFI